MAGIHLANCLAGTCTLYGSGHRIFSVAQLACWTLMSGDSPQQLQSICQIMCLTVHACAGHCGRCRQAAKSTAACGLCWKPFSSGGPFVAHACNNSGILSAGMVNLSVACSLLGAEQMRISCMLACSGDMHGQLGVRAPDCMWRLEIGYHLLIGMILAG